MRKLLIMIVFGLAACAPATPQVIYVPQGDLLPVEAQRILDRATETAVVQATQLAGRQLDSQLTSTAVANVSTQQAQTANQARATMTQMHLDRLALDATMEAERQRGEATRQAVVTAAESTRQANAQATQSAQRLAVANDQATQAAAAKTQTATENQIRLRAIETQAANDTRARESVARTLQYIVIGLGVIGGVIGFYLMVVFGGTIWGMVDTLKAFVEGWFDLKRAEVQAKIDYQRVLNDRQKIYIAGKTLLNLTEKGWQPVTPGQVVEGLLRGVVEAPEVTDTNRLQVRNFLVKCIEWGDAKGTVDRSLVPSASDLGLHPEERARVIRLIHAHVYSKRGGGGGTWVTGGRTLYELLELNRTGDLELNVTSPPISQLNVTVSH